MRRFVIDVNMSPRTSRFLRETYGYDAVDFATLNLKHLDDFEVVEFAVQQQRIVVTEDIGFGQLYFRLERGHVGIIVLRLRLQTVERANRALGCLFSDPNFDSVPLERSLVIIDDSRIRIVTEP